ncbi:speckle-type POZ protein-like isoform X1 [Trichogramma pretiosum]|uniref:speckle-type POZ protein-like isoform X1 n=1 Tax=Trichogramma pretiosum TaxID=7493 RepID=UPI000C71B028|nr:speckle-type POZ protein-like isoform X1 [Trichogramma pretiosum]
MQMGYGSPKFHKLENIDDLISAENTITIQCELEVFKKFKSSFDCPDIIDGNNQASDIVNFGVLFLSEEFSDVKIKISDTHDIPAHKAILAPASPLFMAMFRHDESSGNQKSSVKITIPNVNTVIDMLRFIYTGEVDGFETDQIIKLLEVAHDYHIENLKIKYGKMLCTKLSPANVIDILVSAHIYGVKNLEDEAIKFIKNH